MITKQRVQVRSGETVVAPLSHDSITRPRFAGEFPASCLGLVKLTFDTVVLEKDHQGAYSTRSFDLALGSWQDRTDPGDCPGTFDERALHVDHHHGVCDARAHHAGIVWHVEFRLPIDQR